jgi:hypothetical protein
MYNAIIARIYSASSAASSWPVPLSAAGTIAVFEEELLLELLELELLDEDTATTLQTSTLAITAYMPNLASEEHASQPPVPPHR